MFYCLCIFHNMVCPVTGKAKCECKQRTFRIGMAMVVGIILNLALPFVARPFATKSEIKPPNGAGALSYKGQLMHMLVHHAQVPLTSSVIIAAIVGISACVAEMGGIVAC